VLLIFKSNKGTNKLKSNHIEEFRANNKFSASKNLISQDILYKKAKI
jgi:hypothetical protein